MLQNDLFTGLFTGPKDESHVSVNVVDFWKDYKVLYPRRQYSSTYT
jgi:hypothetical protein